MDRIPATGEGTLGGIGETAANPVAGMAPARFRGWRVTQAPEEARLHLGQGSATARRADPLPKPSPRPSHRSIWNRFVRWCEGRHVEHWPASPETVADYMKVRAENGCRSTVHNIRHAISSTHRAAGFENRFEQGVVEATFKELVSANGWASSQRTTVSGSSLDAAEIEAIREAACERRRQGSGFESRATAKQRGAVELALCSLVLESGILCEQAAALEWPDLSLDKNGRPAVTIRAGPAEPRVVITLSDRAFGDLEAIAPRSPVADQRIFPLGARQIASRVRLAARAVGLESRVAGDGPPGRAQDATKRISPATARIRAGYWRAFGAWCDTRGAEKLPARPETVAQYLMEASETSNYDTILGHRYAIRDEHRDSGHDDPCETPLVRTTLQELHRPSSCFTPMSLDADSLAAIRATAMRPRETHFSRESAEKARRRGLVDIALCSVLYASGLSVEQATALTWREVEILGPDRARLTVKPKTDPRGSVEIREIADEAVSELEAIRGDALSEDRVFGLNCRAAFNRFKAAASAAGLGVQSEAGSSHTATAGTSRAFTENPPHTSR